MSRPPLYLSNPFSRTLSPSIVKNSSKASLELSNEIEVPCIVLDIKYQHVDVYCRLNLV